ncbi:spliceosome-associated protein CWC15 homolog [Acanthaster planci]|uniref:Spliceosome-associated protein CWC15 homolog n=1 Tax=Acanthaster planci TaxID=133434 RepID=A0A8B7YN19_ACAPL|nr:spliceosome-associated protein CWC15 homolog [Acanthaster planci]XP_022093845.1 spliceosome-associated protein CWC15 homolog [Acanthaster planci]XP_022093846.1 spliceosome-associated protein CWC15 homolog [Acanthaster planci]
MTTAARPTFDPARGGRGKGEGGDLSAMSKQYSSRDLPAHTKLKYRQSGQDTAEEVSRRDLRKDLEERERAVAREKRGDRANRESSSNSSTSSSAKRPRIEQIPAANLDADDPIDKDDDEDSDDSDSDDDTADLLAELNKIKKERALEQARKEQERKIEEEKIRTENILSGNPLMGNSNKSDFKVSRRWDDDVVFKNCARGEDDKKEKPFINDTLRSEFHKKFMDKYIH